MARCYVRNGVWGWTIQEQLDALEKAEVLDPERVYKDELSERQAKYPARVRPEWLEQRQALLRPSSRRQDEIHVATLLAIAVSEADLVAVIAQAGMRRAHIHAIDSGFGLACDIATAEGIQQAIEDWQRAKASARTKPGRTAGYIAAAAKKRQETMRKLPPAKPLWRSRKPDRLTEAQIAERVGLSAKTLHQELGRRPAIDRKGKSRGK